MNITPYRTNSIYANKKSRTTEVNHGYSFSFGANKNKNFNNCQPSAISEEETFWQKWKNVIIACTVGVGIVVCGVVGYKKDLGGKIKKFFGKTETKTKVTKETPNTVRNVGNKILKHLESLGLSTAQLDDGTKIADLVKLNNKTINQDQFITMAQELNQKVKSNSSLNSAAVAVLEWLRQNLNTDVSEINNFDTTQEITDVSVLDLILVNTQSALPEKTLEPLVVPDEITEAPNSMLKKEIDMLKGQIEQGIIKDDKSHVVLNLLNKIPEKEEILQAQFDLLQIAIKKKILTKEEFNAILTVLFTPYHIEVLKKQCSLAATAIKENILTEDNKTIITQLLQQSSDKPDTLMEQCFLAATAIEKDILTKDNKTIITQLLQKPSDKPQTLEWQCYLAKAAIQSEILEEGETKNLKQLVIKLSQNIQTNKAQRQLIKTLPDDVAKQCHSDYDSIMRHEIPIQKNLPYLTDEELKAFDESEFINIKTISEKQKQFELEYIIDLKISRGLYDNWDDLKAIIIKNKSILTPEGTKNIYDDGVYNLTVIALKQMPLENRDKFLSSICQETKNPYLKELLTNDQKCDNDKLLTIRPVLKQYEDKQVDTWFHNLSHGYRMPRTTDRCEVVFEEGGQNYLGYKGTSQRIRTKLSQEQIEYLFGEQRPNGHQSIGNCWLVSELKHINYAPGLKLFIMSRFSMDADENVIITLKNDKKVTFKKDIVDKATKITKDEHLSPAMACLSLLAALNRTRETVEKDILKDKDGIFDQDITVDEKYLKKQFANKSSYAIEHDESIKPLTDSQDPVFYGLRRYNVAGEQYSSLLSLFFTSKSFFLNLKKHFTKQNDLNTYSHAWSHYDDTFAANPQNSNTLFKKERLVLWMFRWSDLANKKDWFYGQDTYYVPKVNPKTSEFYS